MFDRGSLVAIPVGERVNYSQHIQSLLKPNFRYLLDVFEYNKDEYAGPPHCLFLDDLNSLYGTKCRIGLIDQQEQRPFNKAQVKNPPLTKNYLIQPL